MTKLSSLLKLPGADSKPVRFLASVKVFGKGQAPTTDTTPIFRCRPELAQRLLKNGQAEVLWGGSKVRALRLLVHPSVLDASSGWAQIRTREMEPAIAASVSRCEAERVRREREAPGSHTEAEWQALLDRFGRKCLRCSASESDIGGLTRDHVTPLSEGGSNSIANLQPLCGRCNSWKGNREIDFRTSRAASAA